MSLSVKRLILSTALLAQVATVMAVEGAGRDVPADEPAFLVVTPDRGFLGDEEIRDAFEEFAAARRAGLAFVTDERTAESLNAAVQSLVENGARRIVVLPLFLSRSDPRYARAAALLPDGGERKVAVEWARPFGESYFAVEALADRLRAVQEPETARIIVVGAGATDDDSRGRMLEDWERLASLASAGLGFESVRAVVETSPERLASALELAARGAQRAMVVPFHLGAKLDGMMSYTALVRQAAPAGSRLLEGDVTPGASVTTWMAWEANRHTPLRAADVGVVALAHGSDYHWNETMRQAIAPLARRYKVEPAFSMADPVVIERAVRRLEARGARFIVILRVFGLASSFRASVERLIGLDVERGDTPDPHAAHAMGHGHGDAHPPARIRSAAVIATVGGLEDDPLFAEALLARAQALSRDPARETVVLVAHGDGDDVQDAHWRQVLKSVAGRMRELGGDRFRAIRTATWREDWPDKRKPAVEEVRAFVQQATANGGRALVIPARTLGRGPEPRLLEGLMFELGEGFAPLPLFARWAESKVAAAVAEEAARRYMAAAGAVAEGPSPGSRPAAAR